MHVRTVAGGFNQADPRLAALLARAERAGRPALSERKRFDLTTPSPGSFGVECDDGDGHLVAYVRCVAAPGDGRAWTMETVIHPHWEGRIEAEVVAVVAVTVLQRGGGTLTWWTSDPAQERAAAPWGFRTERRLEQWRRPLPGIAPSPLPPGIGLRPFDDSPQDRARLLSLNNRAFAGHPEQGSWTEADLQRRVGADWFDPGHVSFAERDGSAIGFCWLKWHRGAQLAEIYAIGVDPDAGARGLGRALATAALADLGRRRPNGTAMLYVDAANDRACALYRSLGFTPHSAQHALQLEVPGVPTLAAPGRADR